MPWLALMPWLSPGQAEWSGDTDALARTDAQLSPDQPILLLPLRGSEGLPPAPGATHQAPAGCPTLPILLLQQEPLAVRVPLQHMQLI